MLIYLNALFLYTLKTKSIAIVDDEQDLVNLYTEALQMSGYEVCSFTNPLLAYEHIKENFSKYSLIITDYKMPQMNGLLLASKLLELDKKMNIVIMSAYEEIEDNNYRFLTKPFKISTLIKIVEEIRILSFISPQQQQKKIK